MEQLETIVKSGAGGEEGGLRQWESGLCGGGVLEWVVSCLWALGNLTSH